MDSTIVHKKCSRCGEVKPSSEFYKDPRIKCGLKAACKRCEYNGRVDKPEYKEQRAAYRARPEVKARAKERERESRKDERVKEMQKATRARYKIKLRAEVAKILGTVCKHCGFSDPRALQFDHINGRGGEERRLLSGQSRDKHILLNPNKYQLLCANCNWIKRHENKEYGNALSSYRTLGTKLQ